MQKSRSFLYLIACFLLLLLSCQERSEKVITDNAGIGAQSDDSINTNSGVYKFRMCDFIDSSVSNQKFLSCMLPFDWDVKYYTKCVTGDNHSPVKFGITAEDTSETQRFELFPVYSFVTTSNSPVGRRDSINANKNNLMRVENISGTAMDAIKDFIIPYCRKDLGSDYHIIEEKPLDNQTLNSQDVNTPTETGMVRIEYTQQGKVFDEIIFATVQKNYISLNGYDSKCLWYINYACSFRTLKGQLNDELGVLQTIIGSIQYNSDWYYKYFHAIQSLTEESYTKEKVISLFVNSPVPHTSADLLPIETSEKEMAKAFDIYTEYDIKIDAYINSTGGVIRLPKGYKMAWKSSKDDYLLAENVEYNPAIKDKIDWVELKKNESLIGEQYLKGCQALN
jgi:hypothetical protein